MMAPQTPHRVDYTMIGCGVKRYVLMAPPIECRAARMIPIIGEIAIDDSRIVETFIHASGPGGQNVNKLATAVQLRLALADIDGLTPEIARRLRELAGRRLTRDGVLVVTARRFRRQEANRRDALDRLTALIRCAAEPAAPRRPTRPTAASVVRRLDQKSRRAATKRERRPAREDNADGG
jgi:ribosome-associated protein